MKIKFKVLNYLEEKIELYQQIKNKYSFLNRPILVNNFFQK